MWIKRILFPVSFAYLILSVFLGGFPLTFLPRSFWNPAAGLLLTAFCFLISRSVPLRPDSDRLKEGLLVSLILGAAAYMRFHGIARLAENGPTIDEPILVGPVLQMIRSGSLDFQSYEYGGVSFYILLAVFLLHYIRLTSSFQYRLFHTVPEQQFYTAGRYAVALFSWLTVLLTYVTARRWFGKMPAVIASVILAFSWLCFTEAQHIRLDITLTLFIVAAHYYFLRLLEEPRPLHYLFAGIFCGLALGTKLTAAPIFVSLVLTHVLAKKKASWPDGNILMALAAGAGIYLLFNAPAFLNLDDFVRRIPRAAHHLNPEHWSSTANRPLLYSRQIATLAIGAAAIIPALITLFRLYYRPDDRILILWCFPLLYFVLIAAFPAGFPRYLLPLIPNLAILAGIGTKQIQEWLSLKKPALQARPALAAATLTAVICAGPVVTAGSYLMEMQKALPSSTVVQWVEANIPPGSRILTDPTGPILPSDKFHVFSVAYSDFYQRNFKDAQYLCVAEDLFERVPSHCILLKEFPAQTKSLDRAIRIYEVPE